MAEVPGDQEEKAERAATRARRRRERCPHCGSDDVVPILYGFPGPDMIDAYDRGDVVLGGCTVFGDGEEMDDRHCHTCERSFVRPRRRPARPLV